MFIQEITRHLVTFYQVKIQVAGVRYQRCHTDQSHPPHNQQRREPVKMTSSLGQPLEATFAMGQSPQAS